MTDRGRPRKGGAPAPLKPRRRYGRWRAATLTSVYLLMGVHIAHWKIAGKTLAPLELNEVMNTLEQGVITAGFIFMSIAVVTVLFFGRFLCSWGCHILALEDLCSWLLKKIGIRPKPFRSRILLLVPPATMFYMFLWPQVSRLLQGRELSEFRVQGDEEGWASFVTDNFWRNLPGPWIIFLTFMICGFLIVYILGSRSFCRYVCPYGVIFAFTDRFAPGNIVSTGECQECGKCTATCQSQVRVHEELKLYGKVVNPACMKDLDCVNICPNHAIGYRFTWPAFFKSWRRKGLSRTRYDFSLGEETLMAVTFLTSLAVFRGLYGYVPFLMSLGLAAVLAFAAVLLVRLTGAGSLKLNNLELKSSGRLTRPGWAFVSLLLIFSLFAAHSGFIRAHEALGNRAYDRVTEARGAGVGLPPAEIAAAIRHYGACDRWGLIDPPYIDQRLGRLHLAAEQPAAAIPHLWRVVARSPGDLWARLSLANSLKRIGRTEEAKRQVRLLIMTPAERSRTRAAHLRSSAHELLGRIEAGAGDYRSALASYRRAIEEEPESTSARTALAEALAETGMLVEAAEEFARVIEADPESARARYNYSVVLDRLRRPGDAYEHLLKGVDLDPTDPEIRNNLGYHLMSIGDMETAEQHFRLAIDLKPDYAQPHFNLARVLKADGKHDEAEKHFRTAAALDPAFAEFLKASAKQGAENR